MVEVLGAEPIRGITLDRLITDADLVDSSNPDAPLFFDLGLAVSDPGDETPPRPPEVVELLPARIGDEEAWDPASQVAADTVMDFLRCSEAAHGVSGACATLPGSALDSERGVEIARRYTRLFGSSAEARTSRQLLASGSGRGERIALLRDLAILLAQLRLLGMPLPAYEGLRDELLEAVRGDLPRDALLADVHSHSRGIPL